MKFFNSIFQSAIGNNRYFLALGMTPYLGSKLNQKGTLITDQGLDILPRKNR